MTATTVPARTPADLLDAALRADPARALLTYYDDATGERTELSVVTFANWVAKTANLCRDDLGLDVGAAVAIALPLHWQAAVWWQACWVSGFVATPLPADPGPDDAGEADGARPGRAYDVAVVAVGGPPPSASAAEVVGLGLGPMGLPVPGQPVPAAVTLDYDREVHGHGDRFARPAIGPRTPALGLGADVLSAGRLGAAAEEAVRRWGLTAGDRVLTTAPLTDLAGLLGGLLGPLATGAGSVLCRNMDRIGAAAVAHRLGQESVTRVTGVSGFEDSGVRRLD
jgi:uncharacterized protein (TIGR03089 family)